jgi:type II secretory pathway pseudopilin PulG
MNKEKTTKIFSPVFGFILVEVIVAIGVLMLALPAALTVASKSVFLASYSKDQVIATYLAHEGIEIVRNRRDQNMLRGDPWTAGIGVGSCKYPDKCIVDLGWLVGDPKIQRCTGACSFILNMDTASGAYSHQTGGTWRPTKFSRYVQTDDAPCNNGGGGGNVDEMCVRSVVTYSAGGVSKTITFMSSMTKWLQ